MGVTNAPAGSPSAGDEEVDEIADKPIVADPVSSTGTDVNAAPSAETSDAVGDRDAEKQPTALDALKAKLVKSEPADADPAPVADDVAEEPIAAEGAEEVADPAAPETPPTEDAAEIDDGLHGFTEREIAHPSNKGMVARIRDLAKRVKTSEQHVRDTEQVKSRGEFLRDFEAKQGLDPEEVVAALNLSAAFKRGDPKALEALDLASAQLRADLGLPDPVAAAPAAVAPYQGVLPQEYADMVSALGIPEPDVRLMYALLKQHREPKPATAPVAARPVPRQVARQPAAPDQAHENRIALAANEAVVDWLETQKVPKDKVKDHFTKNLAKYLVPFAPNGDLSKVPPEDRLRLVKIAQQKHAIAVAKARAADRAKNPPALSSTTSAAAPASNSSKPKSALDTLKARMVAKR